MCLAIPMKVRRISGNFAQVEAGGVLRKVNIQMLSGISEGDYVIVHAGFAIQKIDPDKARQTLELLQ